MQYKRSKLVSELDTLTSQKTACTNLEGAHEVLECHPELSVGVKGESDLATGLLWDVLPLRGTAAQHTRQSSPTATGLARWNIPSKVMGGKGGTFS